MLSRTPSIFIGCMSLYMSKQRNYERRKRRKPSVKVGVSKGAKIGSWSFTRRVSKFNCRHNAFSMHGKCYFWNGQLTCRRTSKLWSCGPRLGQKLKILLSVKIEILTSGFYLSSSQSYVWMFALEFLYHLCYLTSF